MRLTVYVSDLHRYAPMVEKAQAELWGKPPRTMIEVQSRSTSVLRAGEEMSAWKASRAA